MECLVKVHWLINVKDLMIVLTLISCSENGCETISEEEMIYARKNEWNEMKF